MPNSSAGLGYYPEPLVNYMDDGAPIEYFYTDAYLDYALASNSARDRPVDLDNANHPILLLNQQLLASPIPSDPELGTFSQYRSLFLQRLADPLQAYNATTNPYITVDFMSLDLTVFSGEETHSNVTGSAETYDAKSQQRTGKNLLVSDPIELYSYDTESVATSPINTMGTDYFVLTTELSTTLNYLNGGLRSYESTMVWMPDCRRFRSRRRRS